MSNIVYFLGAGASKAFGNPMTNEIMPLILKRLRKHELFQLDHEKTTKERKSEKTLMEMIYMLYPGLESVDPEDEANRDKIPSITEILSLVDHFCFYNLPPHPKIAGTALLQFKELLDRAVGELILEYDLEHYTPEEKQLFERFIKPIRQAKKSDRYTIITTNYDLIIDLAFKDVCAQNKVDYGIPYRIVEDTIYQRNPRPVLHYYKLHGSLNWLRCDLCGTYYINPGGHTIAQAFKEDVDDANTCACNCHLKLKSVIVSPSFVRDIRDSNLLQVWKASLEAIRTADKLFFIGYSLPAEDFGIKSILIRALNGRDPEQELKVTVVVMGGSSRQSYNNVFGDNVDYHGEGLEKYLDGARR